MQFLPAIFTTFLTIVAELSVAIVFGYKKKEILFLVILANLISHPIFLFLLWTNSLTGFFQFQKFGLEIIFLEILIVFFEAFLFYFAFKKSWWQWLNLSFWMNLVSFFLGFLIF